MIDFKKYINKTKTCWIWKGSLWYGYGKLYYKGKNYRAHKFIYENIIGKVPKNLELDHLCRNKTCVNPDHLEAVTHAENVRRAWKERIKNTPNCPHGHPYSGKNLYIAYDKKRKQKYRICKLCNLNRIKKWKKKNILS